MQLGAVALVLVETILGKLRAKVTHHSVARDFGDNAPSGDTQAVAIAVNDRGLRKRKRKNGKAIDEHVIWRNRKRTECNAHCLVRRTQNVDPIDFEMIDNSNTPEDF